MEPQPPLSTELSTGTLRGSERRRLLGVAVPGVDGGVKAGERSDGGGCVRGLDSCRDGADETVEAVSSSSAGAEREKLAWSTSMSVSVAEARGE